MSVAVRAGRRFITGGHIFNLFGPLRGVNTRAGDRLATVSSEKAKKKKEKEEFPRQNSTPTQIRKTRITQRQLTLIGP